MSLLIIGAREIRRLLPVSEGIETMERAMRAASSGDAQVTPRMITPLDGGQGYFFLMPGDMGASAMYGAKVVSLQPGNPERGLPVVQGFVSLFDRETGRPVALLDGAEITTRRTAAATALATRELARPDVERHGIFGNGALAAAHLEAVAGVRDIRETLVWGRKYEKARAFAAMQSERTGMAVRAVKEPAEAASCGVVSAVTNAREPIIKGKWLAAGSHLNLVGAHQAGHREADSEAVSAAAIYVDSLSAVLKESGDILIPIGEGRFGEGDIVGELGQVLTGAIPSRCDARQRTLYKSLGIVAQDLFAAERVYRRALEGGGGVPADFT